MGKSGSKKVKVSYGGCVHAGNGMQKEIRWLNCTIDSLEREREIYLKHYGALRHKTSSMVLEPANDIDVDNDDYDIDFPLPNGHDLPIFPPGEEALLQSHEGREYEEILSSLLAKSNRRPDDRDRSDHIQKQVDSWTSQMPELVSAYLAYLGNSPPVNKDNQPVWFIPVISFEENQERDIFHHEGSLTIPISLARHGLIGCSPEQPSIAVPIHFLHIYHQIHRVCPHYSLDALARSLQHVHFLPQGTILNDQLCSEYDIYLAILRNVKTLCLEALGRNIEQILTTTTCAPCTYKLKDKPSLVPSMLIAMDGNNSLKMVDTDYKLGKPRIDKQTLPDHHWIEDERVNKFKDEVAKNQARQVKSKQKASTNSLYNQPDPASGTFKDEDVAWLEVIEADDLAACIDTCVDRWQNAGPDSKKKMCQMFAVAGIFLAVCHHGHLLVICDMVRSRELMKYPLAIVDKLLKNYGDDLGLGYDIMCAFYKTMKQSDKLGKKITDKRLIGVVPAFHGHAHNQKCQCDWHPQYIPGVGIEDFEGCERTFSLSNSLASVTQLATSFHRRQAILEYFNFNDKDKHALSGNLIYQNYREALERLEEDLPLFEDACQRFRLSTAACEAFLIKEREYFSAAMEESFGDNAASRLC
ncbi:hypothetical protein E1B28_005557 [Marasmius oreades]|uniref:CxC2-like cysteine cluster KDZ transposase-associated domain-containing protein n=1 Tax=Marasmius oreades TaxID=181124 RepID=A0A9P7S3T2_9AGAR|nr:uncharacterized protein E1B28_005557 [Marasmius oreades]KAG7094740.1 hypothetical protein E1B28_005557 [Marasmius oreades]